MSHPPEVPRTHYELIRRHNDLVDIFSKSATTKGGDVSVEPHFRGSDGDYAFRSTHSSLPKGRLRHRGRHHSVMGKTGSPDHCT